MLPPMKRILKIVGIVLLLGAAGFGIFVYIANQVPKPQIASAQGSMAPDFTLKDQDGRDFTLSSLRGTPVLLIFYRGYW